MTFFKLRILGIFSVLILFLSIAPTVFAQSPESFGLISQKILPGDSGYAFKRIEEKVTEFFKFSHQSKFLYRQELLEKRLSELVIMVENKNEGEIGNSSQRFAYQAGILAEGSYKDNPDNKKFIISLFAKYKPIMEKMRDQFPSNTPFWLLSQQNIDTLNILSARLK